MWFVLEGREGGKDIYLFLRALSSPRIGYPSRCARLPAFSEVLCGVYGYRTMDIPDRLRTRVLRGKFSTVKTGRISTGTGNSYGRGFDSSAKHAGAC